MRKIIVTTWVTLDGFIAGPNNEMDFVGERVFADIPVSAQVASSKRKMVDYQ
jgi:hypothetical protein